MTTTGTRPPRRGGRIAALAAAALAATTLAIVTSAAPAQAAAPANDDLAANQLLPDTGDLPITNVEASMEAGERAKFSPLCIGPPTESVWFRYEATTDDVLRIALGAAPGQSGLFDSMLAVYTSSTPAAPTISSLTSRVCNNDLGNVKASRVELKLTAGTTYFVQVTTNALRNPDISTTEPMVMHLTHSPAPAGDDIGNAVPLTPGVVTDATTSYSTYEPGEPIETMCGDTWDSVWFKFTAPSDGVGDLVVTDISPGISSAITAYATESPTPTFGDLTPLDCGTFAAVYDANAGFATEAGKTYWIALSDEGNWYSHYGQGARTVLLTFGPAQPGDDLADAVPTTAAETYEIDTTFGSTEPPELTGELGCGNYNQRTRWFSYTPAASGAVSLAAFDDNPVRGSAMVSVFSGAANYPQLMPEQCNNGWPPSYTFQVVAGRTYFIEAGTLMVKGQLTLQLRNVTTTSLTARTGPRGTVVLDAAVSAPSGNAAGQVDFFEVKEGGLAQQHVASAPVTSGQARFTLTGVAGGRHVYRAVYVPSDPGYLRSTSENAGAQVPVAAATTATVTAPTKVAKGKRASITVEVLTATGLPAAGSVTVDVGGRATTVPLVDGRATLRTGRLRKVGRVVVTATYAGDDDTLGSTATRTITVKKAKKRRHD